MSTMPMPEEMRRILRAALDQQDAQQAMIEKIRTRMVDSIVGKGLRLSPAGMNAAVAAAGAVAQYTHECNHDESCRQVISPESAIEILDEFIFIWAVHRMAEDPNALRLARTAIRPDTARLFLGEPDEVKVT